MTTLRPSPVKATLALHQGLSQASLVRDEVMAGSDVTEMFGAAVNRGLNANLCEALAGLVERSHGVSVGLAWASVRPRDVSVEDFSFSESSADVLRGGAEWLRRTSPYLDAHIVGEVVILARETDEPFDGQAVLAYELDGKPVSLHVQFPEESRDTVIRSFRDGISVSLAGDIYREGRRLCAQVPTQCEPGSTGCGWGRLCQWRLAPQRAKKFLHADPASFVSAYGLRKPMTSGAGGNAPAPSLTACSSWIR